MYNFCKYFIYQIWRKKITTPTVSFACTGKFITNSFLFVNL